MATIYIVQEHFSKKIIAAFDKEADAVDFSIALETRDEDCLVEIHEQELLTSVPKDLTSY